MKLDTLEKIRFITPGMIATTASLPGVLFLNFSTQMFDTTTKWTIPAAALVIGVLYSACGIRDWAWEKEKENYVGKQIRRAFLEMIPSWLEVTEEEKLRLSREAVWKKLNGVFWEVVSKNVELAAQKEHFYLNGAFYTGAIDVSIIMPFFALAYWIGWLVGYGWGFLFTAFGCVFLTTVSYFFVLERRRRTHLKLSEEQIDFVKRNCLKEVHDKFAQIVLEWRTTG